MDSMLVALVAICVALVVLGLLGTAVGLVIRDTVRKRGRWGINLQPAACVKCGTAAPVVRVPDSPGQALWGGWICARCGLELDKWGQPVAEQPFPAKWSARLDDSPSGPQPADTRAQKGREDLQRRDYHA